MNREKAKKIKILITDVDGVLTNAMIGYGNYNDTYRQFNMQDGFGLVLLKKTGIKTAIITGKSSRSLDRRARELKFDLVCKDVEVKMKAFKKILKKFKLTPSEACYIGDDLLDLAVLKNAGLSVCVPEAPEELKDTVDIVTKKSGGAGAVREIIEFILKAQDKWSDIVEKYL
ncbi:MAG: HAD-IIIA family hydrolase [Candidatus Omnitrophota bacterium]